jgi:sarcosine oxidase subunit alpha
LSIEAIRLDGVDHEVEVVSAHFVDPEGERLRA